MTKARRHGTARLVAAFMASGRSRWGSERTADWYAYTLGFLVRAHTFLPTAPEGIEAVMAGLPKLAKETRRDVWSAMRIFYRWAHERHGVPDAMKVLRRPKGGGRPVRTLTGVEVEQLLFANQGKRRDHALVLLLLDTGARIGEAEGLSWRDLDDSSVDEGYTVRLDGKTGERIVPVSPRTMGALRRLSETGVLWVNRSGEELSLGGLKKAVQRALRRAGLKGGPHLLRHTFGRLYIVKGGTEFGLQRMMGHRSLEMTQRYVQLDLRDLQAEHRKFSPIAGVGDGRQLQLVEADRG